jgi:hypothetical protein
VFELRNTTASSGSSAQSTFPLSAASSASAAVSSQPSNRRKRHASPLCDVDDNAAKRLRDVFWKLRITDNSSSATSTFAEDAAAPMDTEPVLQPAAEISETSAAAMDLELPPPLPRQPTNLFSQQQQQQQQHGARASGRSTVSSSTACAATGLRSVCHGNDSDADTDDEDDKNSDSSSVPLQQHRKCNSMPNLASIITPELPLPVPRPPCAVEGRIEALLRADRLRGESQSLQQQQQCSASISSSSSSSQSLALVPYTGTSAFAAVAAKVAAASG